MTPGSEPASLALSGISTPIEHESPQQYVAFDIEPSLADDDEEEDAMPLIDDDELDFGP